MEIKKPQHHPSPYYQKNGDDLLVAGLPVRMIAGIAGQTPFYVYDRSIINTKIAEFREHIPERIHLHYAIKANPHPAVVNHLANRVNGLDIASQKELIVALNSGMPPSEISFAGPSKSDVDIHAAINSGITLNVESETELYRATEYAKSQGIKARVAIRVNPDFELKSSGMKMSGGPKQFGIDAEKVAGIIRQMDLSAVEYMGLHIFSGSQNLNCNAIIDAHNKTFELARRLVKESEAPLLKLNIGGGFGIPYFPGEMPLDLAPIGENLRQLLSDYQDVFSDTEIVIELGRFLVGESGLYVSKINDIKESRGQSFWMTDGGLHHHLANSGNFGQVIRKNYPVCVATKASTAPSVVTNIVGPLCTPLDILADKYLLPEAQIGDLVAIFQSGAYGPTASPLGFLSQPGVVELLL